MIKAEIVADSLSIYQDRLTSVVGTFPRIILSEVNTHRMLSKNTSSSRAIPTFKMIKSIQIYPFVPIAWQKEHTGMQGNQYFEPNETFNLKELKDIMIPKLMKVLTTDEEGKDIWMEEYDRLVVEDAYKRIINMLPVGKYTLNELWLHIRDKVLDSVLLLYGIGVTKQIANRLLEPFMWTTMLITGSKEGWDNFFKLRCPEYIYRDANGNGIKWRHKSKKEFLSFSYGQFAKDFTDLDWLRMNEGQAEIHMMAFAESVYDAMNESIPKQLKAGEAHIPFEKYINIESIKEITIKPTMTIDPTEDTSYLESIYWGDVFENIMKVSVSMAARTSYTIIGNEKEINYNNLIKLHDKLIIQEPPHSSPMEHYNVAMNEEEYFTNVKGAIPYVVTLNNHSLLKNGSNRKVFGWCRNFKGFIQYRHLIETNN